MLASLRQRARALKRETYALYLSCRDRRTPWYARLVAVCIVAYALSPVDLIPDVVPILGYLDDLLLVPLGIALAIKLIPAEVLAESRARAAAAPQRPISYSGAVVIVGIWLALAGAALWWLVGVLTR